MAMDCRCRPRDGCCAVSGCVCLRLYPVFAWFNYICTLHLHVYIYVCVCMRNVCTHARTGIETGVLWRLIVRDVRCMVPDHSERRERKRKKERNRERRKNRSRSRMGNGQREAEEKGREGKMRKDIISYHIIS